MNKLRNTILLSLLMSAAVILPVFADVSEEGSAADLKTYESDRALYDLNEGNNIAGSRDQDDEAQAKEIDQSELSEISEDISSENGCDECLNRSEQDAAQGEAPSGRPISEDEIVCEVTDNDAGVFSSDDERDAAENTVSDHDADDTRSLFMYDQRSFTAIFEGPAAD